MGHYCHLHHIASATNGEGFNFQHESIDGLLVAPFVQSPCRFEVKHLSTMPHPHALSISTLKAGDGPSPQHGGRLLHPFYHSKV